MDIIIGSGITGISAAASLDSEYRIFEKNSAAGGLSTSYISSRGHEFDFGGHYFHFHNKAEVLKHIEQSYTFKKFSRDSRVYMMNRIIPYPVQYHLSFLPGKFKHLIVKEILENKKKKKHVTLKSFLINNFGETLFELFFKPFMEKYYRISLSTLVADMDRGSIPVPDISQLLQGAEGIIHQDVGYNAHFFYPEKCSLRDFIKKYSEHTARFTDFNKEITGIDFSQKTVTLNNKEVIKYSRLISTMPLNQLLSISTDEKLKKLGKKLRHTSTLITNGIIKNRTKTFNWLYLPEEDTPFYRAGYYPSQDKTKFYLERTLFKNENLSAENILQEAGQILVKTGMCESAEDISDLSIRKIPVSYIVFDRNWSKTVPPVLKHLKSRNVYSIGRYGSWNYSGMSDDIQSALNTAAMLNTKKN